MKLLLLDTEQAAMVKEGADVISRMMGFRLERADPDGIISASRKLQARKLEQAMSQLAMPVLPDWHTLKGARRDKIKRAARALIESDDPSITASAFTKILGEFIAAREDAIDEYQPSGDDASPEPNAQAQADAEAGAAPAPALR